MVVEVNIDWLHLCSCYELVTNSSADRGGNRIEAKEYQG